MLVNESFKTGFEKVAVAGLVSIGSRLIGRKGLSFVNNAKRMFKIPKAPTGGLTNKPNIAKGLTAGGLLTAGFASMEAGSALGKTRNAMTRGIPNTLKSPSFY